METASQRTYKAKEEKWEGLGGRKKSQDLKMANGRRGVRI